MGLTAAEYLRKIKPSDRDSKGRWRPIPEERWQTFCAIRDVLTAGAAEGDLRRVVAATHAAASRHGAEVGGVWRLVRRYQERAHDTAEQLVLPLGRGSRLDNS
jgi:hypothetical protein